MVTLQDIARKVNVSTKTVSLVLNGKLKGVRSDAAARAEEIKRVAAEMGYRPNTAARAIQGQGMKQAGVLLPNCSANPYHNPAAFQTLIGVNSGLQEAGYVACLVRLDEVVEKLEDSDHRVLNEQLVDGLIVIGSMPPKLCSDIERVYPKVIWADTDVFRETCCIRRDEKEAAATAARELIKLGCRKLHLVVYPQHRQRHFSHADRCIGVLSEAGKHGIPVEECNLDMIDKLPGRIGKSEAVLVDNPNIALFAMSHCLKHNLHPGRNFRLASLGDSFSWALPELSEVTFDRYGMGMQAAEMLLQLINNGIPPPSRLLHGLWQERPLP